MLRLSKIAKKTISVKCNFVKSEVKNFIVSNINLGKDNKHIKIKEEEEDTKKKEMKYNEDISEDLNRLGNDWKSDPNQQEEAKIEKEEFEKDEKMHKKDNKNHKQEKKE
jgi:hypothetical protein